MTAPLAFDPAALLDEQQRRLVPFEYQFQFDLIGRGRAIKKSVVVSVEAAFIAVSIGYGVIPEVQSVTFGPRPPKPTSQAPGKLDQVTIAEIVAGADAAFSTFPGFSRSSPASDAALRAGIQINPEVAELALQGAFLSVKTQERLFRIAGSASSEIQFLYALSDEGTGRTFQSEPILNTAGLGISNGDRPFRHFSPPIVFDPRTTIGLEITEVSNFVGKLYVSLQGHKVLGGAGSPTAPGGPPRRPTPRRSR